MPTDYNHYTPTQANATAISAMEACADALDARFGDGYARANPQLLAAMVQSSALDMAGESLNAAAMTVAAAWEERD